MSYSGTAYCGWQRQPNGVSVQQRVEEALYTVLRQEVTATGAGRTDAGVHARMMVAHIDLDMPPDSLPLLTRQLNGLLPPDIAIRRIVPVRTEAHARFDALARTYQYTVTETKNPFNHEWVCRMPLQQIQFERMNEACRALLTHTDFTSFSKTHTEVKTYCCRITRCEWTACDETWVFTICADRFLRNMVRAIVGTLFDVGRHKLTCADFDRIIRAKDRRAAGASAEAGGLALTDIRYPPKLFL